MGVGIIAQDHNGRVSTTLCKQVSLMPKPTTREAMRALLAAEFSRDMGLQDILHKGNSMNAVNAIRGGKQTRVLMGMLWKIP
jgi:hypothetical protein